MLKDQHSIWMYFPSIEQSQRISGHMVRQGFMGGAVSYEDMMHFSSFTDNYSIVSSERRVVQETECIFLQLKGKNSEMSYPIRNICVEPKSAVVCLDQMFSLDGTPMKEMRASDIQKFTSEKTTRYYPKKIEIINQLETSLSTELIYETLEYDVLIDESEFSLRWLER